MLDVCMHSQLCLLGLLFWSMQSVCFAAQSVPTKGEFGNRNYFLRYTPAYWGVEIQLPDKSWIDAWQKGLEIIYKYVSGHNQHQLKLTIETPLMYGQRISNKSTDPVRPRLNFWIRAMIKGSFDSSVAPLPLDPMVIVRRYESHWVVGYQYEGRWDRLVDRKALQRLKSWLRTKDRYRINGNATFARIDPAITPAFLRRNEVWLPVILKDL